MKTATGFQLTLRASLPWLALGAVVLLLIAGTIRNPEFWRTADQRGDALLRAGHYAEAAKAYRDPWRIGVAQYRNGDFEAAGRTFARVPGARGAYDQANALLMHGQYDQAIASYRRALGFQPHWSEAEENMALAAARKAKMEAAGEGGEKEQSGQFSPDDIAFDQHGDDQEGKPVELAGGDLSDEQLQATWLRRVQTTPGDFLRAKFAWQAARSDGKEAPR